MSIWQVFKGQVTFPDGTEKDKYLIEICSTPRLFLVINSKLPQQAIDDSHLRLACYLTIDHGTHTFLQYDSFISCKRAWDTSCCQGLKQVGEIVTSELRRKVLTGILDCPVLKRSERTEVFRANSEMASEIMKAREEL